MKPMGKAMLAGLCAVAVTAAVFLITPAYARYSSTATTTAVYGHTDTFTMTETLSAATTVYDFGRWAPGVDEDTFTHTLRLMDSRPLSGVLRFSWDDTTRSQRDLAVMADSAYYDSVQNSGYTDYAVSSSDGRIEFPFYLIFSAPSATRVAVLDVSWYPEDSDEATLFSRYLVTLAPTDAEGSAPTFVAEDTAFLTDRLLQATVTTPSEYEGVWISPDDGSFAAGTRYFTDTYSQGVTLVRDTALYLPRTADSRRVLMDLSAHLTGDTPMSLRVGVSDTVYSTQTCTPLTEVIPLTVTLSDPTCVVSTTRSLTVTLAQAEAFRDSDWNQEGDTPADLVWQVYRRVDGALQPVSGEALTVTVTQTATGGSFHVAVTDGSCPPGTYVLLLTQMYHGYSVLERPIWFFIDYR